MSSLLDDDYVYNQEDFNFALEDTIENNSENMDIEYSVDSKVPTTLRRQLLFQAADIIDGDRNKTYGKPENSYGEIAKFWSSYLDIPLEPHDVAALMVLMKIARVKGSKGSHTDSWVDIAGYAACGYEVKQNTK